MYLHGYVVLPACQHSQAICCSCPAPLTRRAAMSEEDPGAVAQPGDDSSDDGLTAHEIMLKSFPPLDELRTTLTRADDPAGKKMRAIYYLRTIGSAEANAALMEALLDKSGSPLLRHELAYVLGQLRNDSACDVLEKVLADTTDNVMVRHEAAEALGAIGAARSLDLLDKFTSDPLVEVGETCKIAADFMRWKHAGEAGERPVMCACMSPYSSHDPAPADPRFDGAPVEEVGAVLQDATKELFLRYGAMFHLRNRGGEAAVAALGRALVQDQSSALLRHEVAYVLGQMQHPAAIEPLAESLRRSHEHSMVRHEAAEALGAIEGAAADMTKCEALLQEFMADSDSCVRESCEVALDAQDYWAHQRWKDVKEQQAA